MFNKKSLIVLMLIAVLAIAFVEWRFSTNISHLYNDVVLDNKEHFLSCEELPPSSDVTQIVAEHQETIKRIEQVNPRATMHVSGHLFKKLAHSPGGGLWSDDEGQSWGGIRIYRFIHLSR